MIKVISMTKDAEKLMAYCARVSSPHQDNPEFSKLFDYCITHGHWSVFEQAFLTVEITTSRAISAQLLRHRSFTFQEHSMRYAASNSGYQVSQARRQDKTNRQNSIDDLSDSIKEQWIFRQKEHFLNAMDHYNWAIENGIAKECARSVLPLQTTTRLYMTGSIRSWIHYLMVRTHKDTQLEHRDIAVEIQRIFVSLLPTVSGALGW